MSTVIRRMPRLAARGLAALARTSTAAAVAPRAPPAARFAPLSSRPGWLQQADWRQSFRRFSAAAEPEGAEAPAPAAEEPTVDDVVAADAEPAAAADAELAEDQAVPEAESNNKLFVFNLSWGVDDEVRHWQPALRGPSRCTRDERPERRHAAPAACPCRPWPTCSAATAAW